MQKVQLLRFLFSVILIPNKFGATTGAIQDFIVYNQERDGHPYTFPNQTLHFQDLIEGNFNTFASFSCGFYQFNAPKNLETTST